MSHDPQELKSYLASLLPENELEAVADTPPAETPMRMAGGMPAPRTDNDRAHDAVQKLAIGQSISDHEAFLIEAIIIPDQRPAIDIDGTDFTVDHKAWKHFGTDAGIKTAIQRVIPSVGRIELPDHNSLPYGGTGFVVSDGLLMTNRHVAAIFVEGVGQQRLRFQPGQTAGIDFRQETGNDETQFLDVTGVRMIHPYWDMALLEVAGLPAGVVPLRLSVRDPEDMQDSEIAVIGYPAFDSRNNTEVQNQVFRGIYNVKRLQPGLLRRRKTVNSFGNLVDSVTHDASTLGGNSGSCVMDVATGEIVALHFAGRYKRANYAVPTSELSRDSIVVDAGVNFAAGAGPLPNRNPWAFFWNEADANREAAALPTQLPTTNDAGTQSISVPIMLNLTIGANGQPTGGVDAGVEGVEPTHDRRYGNRTGYDPAFLGTSIALPKTGTKSDLSRLDDDSIAIPYQNFSVVMNRVRRMALLTAANIDGTARKPDPTRKYTRHALNGFTKNSDREQWFTDPRIPALHQLPDSFFTRDRASFDKGHVVRRNDIVWGPDYETVQRANGDSFHVTNCSPQVKGFNRSIGGGVWGKLENAVLKAAKNERITIFAGPVLADDDPIFAGVDDWGLTRVRIPRAYWKVIVAKGSSGLECFAFCLDQDLSDVDMEFAMPDSWAARQVPLKEIEERTGRIGFAKKLHNADTYGAEAAKAVEAATGVSGS